MISGAIHCAQKELRIRLRDRWAVILWIVIPLTIGGMVTSLSGGGQPQPTVQLLVVDEDNSFISGLLINALGQAGDSQIIQAQSVSREEGESRIEAGDGSALLILPPGFGDAVLNEKPSTLELITNPAQQILPAIAEEFLSVLTDGMFYLHRVFGDELKLINDQINNAPEGSSQLFSDALIAQISVSFNNAAESLVSYLDPMALELKEIQEEEEGTGISYALLFFPGTIFMGCCSPPRG